MDNVKHCIRCGADASASLYENGQLTFGYGSIHDGSIFITPLGGIPEGRGLCDRCTEIDKGSGLIEEIGSYISGSDHMKEDNMSLPALKALFTQHFLTSYKRLRRKFEPGVAPKPGAEEMEAFMEVAVIGEKVGLSSRISEVCNMIILRGAVSAEDAEFYADAFVSEIARQRRKRASMSEEQYLLEALIDQHTALYPD